MHLSISGVALRHYIIAGTRQRVSRWVKEIVLAILVCRRCHEELAVRKQAHSGICCLSQQRHTGCNPGCRSVSYLLDGAAFWRYVIGLSVSARKGVYLFDTGDQGWIPMCRRPADLSPTVGERIVTGGIDDAMPVIGIADKASLENYATRIVVRMAGAKCIFIATVRRRRAQWCAPSAARNVVEPGLLFSPGETAVIAASRNYKDLIVPQKG